MLLTKEQLLKGSRFTAEVEIPELGGSIKVRALKDDERMALENWYFGEMAANGLSFKDMENRFAGVDDIGQMNKIAEIGKQREWRTLAYGLSVDGVSYGWEELKVLEPLTVQELTAKINELTFGKPKQVDNFREKQLGADALALAEAGIPVEP